MLPSLKSAGLAVVVLAIAWGVYLVNGWRDDSKALVKARADFAAQMAAKDKLLETERDDRTKADASAASAHAEIDRIHLDQHDHPLPAVRVCKPASATHLPPASAAAADPHGAVEADDARADAQDRDAGTDIGPALDDYATDSAANLAQCQALQQWVLSRTH